MKKAISLFNFLKSWWKNLAKRTKIILCAVFVIVILIILKGGGSDDGTVIETVKRQTLNQTVSASGTVVSSTDLSLGFEQSKIVQSIKVLVGDTVKKGDILAALSNGNERAALSSARGALLSARAKYNKVLEGSSNEEIALAKVSLDSIKKTQDGLVEDARKKLLSADLIARSDSINQAISPIISGVYSGEEGSYVIVSHASGGGSNGYVAFSGVESGTSSLSTYSPSPMGKKGLFVQMPVGINVSEGSTWTINIPNISGSSYVSNLNAYQSAKNSRDQAIAVAQAELDLKRATARQPDIDQALADVVIAEAGVDQAISNLEKTILRAPAPGTITKVDIKIGELSSVGAVAIALQDISNLYLEANINESNIRDIEIGQSITVTFDAFGDDEYSAAVSSIDPASTTTNNVVNYKIKALIEDTKKIRPGMTANMIVLTSQVENALVLPGRTIEIKNNKSQVHFITDERKNKSEMKDIEIGLRGDGDLVEIKSGLSEGDKVLWIPPTTK